MSMVDLKAEIKSASILLLLLQTLPRVCFLPYKVYLEIIKRHVPISTQNLEDRIDNIASNGS